MLSRPGVRLSGTPPPLGVDVRYKGTKCYEKILCQFLSTNKYRCTQLLRFRRHSPSTSRNDVINIVTFTIPLIFIFAESNGLYKF